MLMLAWSLLLCAASTACGMAALGLTLYAQGPSALAAAQLFGAVGGLVGLLCGGLHQALLVAPDPRPAPLAPDALARLVRATLADLAAERQGRPRSPGPVATTPPVRPASVTERPPSPAVPARAFASSAFGA